MYRKANESSIASENFELPFSGKLLPDNHWVIMAQWIKFIELEKSELDVRRGGNDH